MENQNDFTSFFFKSKIENKILVLQGNSKLHSSAASDQQMLQCLLGFTTLVSTSFTTKAAASTDKS